MVDLEGVERSGGRLIGGEGWIVFYVWEKGQKLRGLLSHNNFSMPVFLSWAQRISLNLKMRNFGQKVV